MKMKFKSKFVERVEEAALEWKAGSAREKFRATVYGLARAQREGGQKGLKDALGWSVITVSSKMIAGWYHDTKSQVKFRRVLTEYAIIVKDNSWMSAMLAKDQGKDPYSNSWHFTEPDFTGPSIEVEYDDNYGLFGFYKREIIKAEGRKVDGANSFHGKWALDAYIDGKEGWEVFYEVGKAAHNVLKRESRKGPSCRTFDAVALCKKELRGKCFNDGTHEMKEVWDIAGAITITALVGSAALGVEHSIQNKHFITWADNLSVGSSPDPYERIWKTIYEIDPNTNAYGTKRKWTKAIRKTIKTDVQCVANCSIEYLKECERAYREFFTERKVKQNLRRQWLVWQAIKKCKKELADAIHLTKESRVKDGFYRLHTLGEKTMMEVLIEDFRKAGIVVHRVHDALWTSDERLTSLSEKSMGVLVGKMFLKCFKGDPGWGRSGIERMVARAKVTREEIAWVKEGVKTLQ